MSYNVVEVNTSVTDIQIWLHLHFLCASMMMLEKTQTVWEPYVFHVILALPIAAALMLLQGIVDFIRALKIVFDGECS